MKILTRPAQIRSALRELLSEAADTRIIAVAYVGIDAPSFLTNPSGITLYCWPQAGATNPHAIDSLLKRGVLVRFANRLHAKVYWSKHRGALIGSANLTRNALGEAALQEAVVWVPPGAFDIQSFAASLDIEPDFDAALKRLHESHVRFMQRNPSRHRGGVVATGPKRQSFTEWFSSEGRPEWRLG